MIKLTKCDEPDILVKNKAKWTSEIEPYIGSGQPVPSHIQNRYNHDDIKDSLRKETNGGKCMYCESPIAVVAPEHIEHYRPKSIYPRLAFDWSNLGLACPWCNIKKGNVFDESCTYINPYHDLPQEHFVPVGTMVYAKPNDKRAKITELQLELNRPELIEARKERMEAVRSMAEQHVAEVNPTLKSLLKGELKKKIEKEKPYSMCTRAMVKSIMAI